MPREIATHRLTWRSIEIEVAWGVVLDEYAALFTSSRRRASLTEALARVADRRRADQVAAGLPVTKPSQRKRRKRRKAVAPAD